ncbi:hypothetical protein HPB47_018712, partial [Ixodes persulcatus]
RSHRLPATSLFEQHSDAANATNIEADSDSAPPTERFPPRYGSRLGNARKKPKQAPSSSTEARTSHHRVKSPHNLRLEPIKPYTLLSAFISAAALSPRACQDLTMHTHSLQRVILLETAY